jgi:hypothetical protein
MSEIYKCLNCGFEHDKYPAEKKCQSCRSSDPLKKVDTKTVPLKKISIGDFKKPVPKTVEPPKPPIIPHLPHPVHDLPVSPPPPAPSVSPGTSPVSDSTPWCISINKKINKALLILTFIAILLFLIINIQLPTIPKPTTSSSTATSEMKNNIRRMINDYLMSNEKKNLKDVLSFYEDQVDFYGSGIVNKDFISKDKSSYFKRWTVIKTTIMGEPEINLQEKGILSVNFNTNWIVKKNKKIISGTANNTWKLRNTNSGLKIFDEKQKTTSKSS